MVRRLARRQQPQRKTPPQSLPHQESSGSVRKEDAQRTRGETPPQTTAHAIAEAWAAAAPPASHRRQAATQLAEALRPIEGQVPHAVILQLAAEWRKRYSHSTYFCRTHTLRKILRAIDRETGSTLAQLASPGKKPHARNVTIEPADLERLLSLAEPDMQMFISLAAFMGLRFSEAWAVGRENHNPETGTLTFTGKGNHTTTLPIAPQVQALIDLTPEGPGSFVERLRGRSITKTWMRQRWENLKRKARVPMEINPHDLRRTAAVNIYRATKDVLTVKHFLGHEALSSTAHYLQPYDREAMQHIREAMLRHLKGETIQ